MTREARELGLVGMQIYRHSHLGRVLLKRYVDWQIAKKYPLREDQLFQNDGFHEKEWRRMESEYDKMSTIAASIGSRMVIAHIPQKGPWTAKSRYPAARFSAPSGPRSATSSFSTFCPQSSGRRREHACRTTRRMDTLRRPDMR